MNGLKQLPQCSSHDLLEGCAKMWILGILKHFVRLSWVTWDQVERLITIFPFKGKDSRSRPAVQKGKKMKNKQSRKVIGKDDTEDRQCESLLAASISKSGPSPTSS